MSWDFYNAYADEVYAVLSNDWIDDGIRQAPPGLDFAALQTDLKLISS